MRYLFILFCLLSYTALAQFIARPVVMQNAFQIEYNRGVYDYGGKFGSSAFVPGLDLEYRFIKELDSLSSPTKLATNSFFAILFNASYWKYSNNETGYNKSGDKLASTYNSQFISMPLMAKYYMQLGVLNEKMRLGWGVGAIGLYRLKTELHEEAIIYTRSPTNNSVIGQKTIEDTADIEKLSPTLTIGYCIEGSFEYGRFYVAFRAFGTTKDQYAKGIESSWKIPETQSIYLQAYKAYPKITYTGGGVLLGWRITPMKKY